MVEMSLREFVHRTTGKDPARIPDDFSTRLMFQKVLYLAQEEGVLRSPRYDFNLYFYGPYSPDWARIGYEIAEGSDVTLDLADGPHTLDYLIDERNPGGPENLSAWLAALATLHWYVVHLGLDRQGAIEKAEANGKSVLLRRFEDAWSALDSVDWLR